MADFSTTRAAIAETGGYTPIGDIIRQLPKDPADIAHVALYVQKIFCQVACPSKNGSRYTIYATPETERVAKGIGRLAAAFDKLGVRTYAVAYASPSEEHADRAAEAFLGLAPTPRDEIVKMDWTPGQIPSYGDLGRLSERLVDEGKKMVLFSGLYTCKEVQSAAQIAWEEAYKRKKTVAVGIIGDLASDGQLVATPAYGDDRKVEPQEYTTLMMNINRKTCDPANFVTRGADILKAVRTHKPR